MLLRLTFSGTFFFILLNSLFITEVHSQNRPSTDAQKKEITLLIDQYAQARERRDTILLKNILVDDVDQLVSSGEWRIGIREAVSGMMRSSESNPGSRRFIIEKIKFLDSGNGIVDARYEIENSDGTKRKMWSTFIVVNKKGQWKISAIRNMLPSTRQ